MNGDTSACGPSFGLVHYSRLTAYGNSLVHASEFTCTVYAWPWVILQVQMHSLVTLYVMSILVHDVMLHQGFEIQQSRLPANAGASTREHAAREID
jgi:hypothetical protein